MLRNFVKLSFSNMRIFFLRRTLFFYHTNTVTIIVVCQELYNKKNGTLNISLVSVCNLTDRARAHLYSKSRSLKSSIIKRLF